MKRIYFLAVAIFAAITLSAQQLPKDENIREGHLANGLTYYIRHNTQTPGQADFYIAQRVGSILEDKDQRGLAHFLEHMAFNGTEHFPDGNAGPRSIRSWCERNGIKFGADLNASTAIERTIYNIANAPVTKAGVTDTCLLILSDWSHALLLRDNEIDQERGVIHEEWRTRRSSMAAQRIMEEAMPVIYKGTKYEDCLPIGSMEVVDTFRYEALRRYYNKWYRPDLQAVIVVGDINVDEIEQKVKSLFSGIPATANAAVREYYPVTDNDEMIIFSRADDEQPTLNFQLFMKRDAASVPNSTSVPNTASVPDASASVIKPATLQDFTDDYKSRLALFVLRQRLSELTRQAHPAVLSCSARDGQFYITSAKDAFSLSIGLRPDCPQAGIDAAMAVVQKIRRYGITEAELTHAKMQHNVNLEHRIDTKDKTRNSEYVGKIINHFCNGNHLMSIDQEADIEHSLMDSITLDDVNAKLRQIIFSPAQEDAGRNQVAVIYGPTAWDGKDYMMPTAEQFKEWILTAEKREYADDNDYRPVDRTFIKKLPKKGRILARNDYGNGYTEYVLSNGIKVYARPSTLEPNRLTIKMFRQGGQLLYPDKDLPSLRLLSSVITQSGAADFDYLTLEKKRAGKAIRVTPFISDEEEGVQGVCAASDFKTWLEVAYLYITQPRYDADIFSSIIERQRSLLKNRAASPKVVFNDTLRNTLYANPERVSPLTIESISHVSHNRIMEIYNERFHDMAEMSLIVTGDIRTDEFENLICQYVASLPAKKPKAATAPQKATAPKTATIQGASASVTLAATILPGERTKVFTHDQKTPSALTEIIYTAPIAYNADNDLRADVLAQILRGIYTETVREEKGGTYGVSVASQGWTLPSDGFSITINFRCDPVKYTELLPVIDEQLKKMAAEGPSAERLQKVKEYERKNYERAILSNGWWEYVCYHKLAEGVDFGKDYCAKVDALTPKDIQDFCRDILAAGNRVQVTMK